MQLKTKSEAIIDNLEERNGSSDDKDRSRRGQPNPPIDTTQYHLG